MRIVLVNKFWFERGGAERVLFDTKKLLEAAGHTVTVFGMNHPQNLVRNQYFIDEVDYRRMSIWGKIRQFGRFIYNVQAKRNFAKLIKEFRPDIVHLHNIYHQISFSILDVLRQTKIPVVMTLHDYKMISPNYNMFHHGRVDESVCRHPFLCLFNNCMENCINSLGAVIESYWRAWRGYKNVITTFISPSNFLRGLFTRYGFSENKIVVVPNPYLGDTTKEITLGDDVLYFGRLSTEKGTEFFIRAAAQLPQINFIVAGTGPQESYLKKIAPANVKFTGQLSAGELNDVIRLSRLVVVPSVCYDNYPASVIEAKAQGKIVLGSAIGGLPELIDKEFLFSPGNVDELKKQIEKWYAASSDQLLALGKKSQQEVVKNNNPADYLASLLSIYEKAVRAEKK